jgi:hypothetical protein
MVPTGGFGLHAVGASGQVHHRAEPDKHDDERGERAIFEGAAGRMAVDQRRQGFDVERAKEQGRRELLEAIDEHQQRGARERRAEERQLDAQHELARLCAERAGRVLDAARDPRQPGGQGAGRDRQEADDIGDHDGRARPHQHEPQALAGQDPPDRVQEPVDGKQRSEQAERQHGARHRIAETDHEAHGRGEGALCEPRGRHHHDPEEKRSRGCRGGERERRHKMPHEDRVELGQKASAEALPQEEARRQHEPQQHRHRAGDSRDPAEPARQRCRLRHARPPGRDRVAAMVPGAPLERDEGDHDR